jgi:hypothetical protein
MFSLLGLRTSYFQFYLSDSGYIAGLNLTRTVNLVQEVSRRLLFNLGVWGACFFQMRDVFASYDEVSAVVPYLGHIFTSMMHVGVRILCVSHLL